MGSTGENLDAAAQVERARATLGEALGLTQDIQQAGLDVEQVSATLALAIKELFALKKIGLGNTGSGKNAERSMRYLRQTLVLLQEVQGSDPALEKTTSAVARTLALLFPVAKIAEKAGEKKARESGKRVLEEVDVPLPLSQSMKKKSTPLPVPAKEQKSVSSQGDERRNMLRRKIFVEIGMHSPTNFFTGFSHDISDGGLFIATYDILELGSMVNVNFALPSKKGDVLSIDGTVCWIREYHESNSDCEPGMGIKFDKLTPPIRDAINKFIAKKPPLFYDHD